LRFFFWQLLSLFHFLDHMVFTTSCFLRAIDCSILVYGFLLVFSAWRDMTPHERTVMVKTTKKDLGDERRKHNLTETFTRARPLPQLQRHKGSLHESVVVVHEKEEASRDPARPPHLLRHPIIPYLNSLLVAAAASAMASPPPCHSPDSHTSAKVSTNPLRVEESSFTHFLLFKEYSP